MKRITALLVLCLVAAAGGAIGAPVPTGPTLSVLVAGRPVAEHALAGTTYVEAAVGTEYTVRLVNPYQRRIGVTLTVDGLNTIDAKESGGRLWILEPNETAVIPGWQISGATARKFVVSEEGDSYARALGKRTETGVVKAVFVEERDRYALLTPIATLTNASNVIPVAGSTWTLDSGRDGAVDTNVTGSMTLAAPLSGSTTAASMPVSTNTSATAPSLGTAQGQRTEHVVHEVTFERGAEIGTVELRYVTPARLAGLLRDARYAPERAAGRWCPETR